MGHVAGPLHILLVKKEMRIWFNIICLKLYQFERTTWWCLSALEYVIEISFKFFLKYVMLEKKKKSWSLKICISPPLGDRHDVNPGRP